MWSSPRVKTEECKDHRLYRATPPGRDIRITFYSSYFPHLASLLFQFLWPTLMMCFHIPTITTTCKPRIAHNRQCNPNNLCLLIHYFCSISLWNCRSAVNISDFITSISRGPEDTATPAALSNTFTCFHSPRLTGRGGGTGLLTLMIRNVFIYLLWVLTAHLNHIQSLLPTIK